MFVPIIGYCSACPPVRNSVAIPRGKIATMILLCFITGYFTALLTGCSSTPSKTLPAKGYEGSAQEYQRLAETVSGRTRSSYLLSAAEDWLRVGRTESAAAALAAAAPDPRDFPMVGRAQLLTARLAKIRGRPTEVMTALEGLPQPSTPTISRVLMAELRAWALLNQEQGAAAARVLADIAPLLVETEKVRANREALWEALGTVPDAELPALAASAHPILGPWAELAQIQRTYWGKNPEGLDAGVRNWHQRHKIHPVTEELLAQLLARPQRPRSPPSPSPSPSPLPLPMPVPLKSAASSQVALVLPNDGSAARAAAAVRDGFLAAWYAAPEQNRPPVTFHLFASGMVKTAYHAAVEAGATLIIGPIAKEEVQTLIQGGELSRPTLALNYLSEGAEVPARLYQFGLSPTDEARQGAQQAWIDGRTQAFIVIPSGDWGGRVQQAFRAQWETIGGTVLRSIAAESDPAEIAAALQQGHDNPLGTMFNNANRKDFIFLSTPPEIARRVSPLLRQTGLPVYATSHVLSGTRQDAELTDLQVVDLPWLVAPDPTAAQLRADLERLWPNDFVTYRRIYALGVDAFRLAGELGHLENEPSARVQGVTGSLSLDAERRVVRQGAWAKVEGGRLIPMSAAK
ncbi:putative Penicillin-binding protein activator [Gammaproteobacteria bacterium]